MARRHRVLRKANRVARNELDRRFDVKLSAERSVLHGRLEEVNKTYSEALRVARLERDAGRRDAWKVFEVSRDALLLKLGKEVAEDPEKATAP